MGAKIDKQTKVILVMIGQRVRATRERLGVSQVKLARLVGMEPTNLAKVERGTRNVTIDTLARIADGLGIELNVTFSSAPPRRARGES